MQGLFFVPSRINSVSSPNFDSEDLMFVKIIEDLGVTAAHILDWKWQEDRKIAKWTNINDFLLRNNPFSTPKNEKNEASTKRIFDTWIS